MKVPYYICLLSLLCTYHLKAMWTRLPYTLPTGVSYLTKRYNTSPKIIAQLTSFLPTSSIVPLCIDSLIKTVAWKNLYRCDSETKTDLLEHIVKKYKKDFNAKKNRPLYHTHIAFVVSAGGNPNIPLMDNQYMPPLKQALLDNNCALAKLLLQEGACPNDKRGNYIPSFFLARNVKIANLLLLQGADLHETCDSGDTVFHYILSETYPQNLISLYALYGTNLDATPLYSPLHRLVERYAFSYTSFNTLADKISTIAHLAPNLIHSKDYQDRTVTDIVEQRLFYWPLESPYKKIDTRLLLLLNSLS